MVKIPWSEVQKRFKELGLILLSEEREYKRAGTPLRYICPDHVEIGEQKVSYNAIKYRKSKCPSCGGRGKVTLEMAKKEFAKDGYILLETEFINTQTKMRYRCPHHPDKELSMHYSNRRLGKMCPHCRKKARMTKEEAIAEYLSYGFEFTDDKFRGTLYNHKLRCPKHPDKDDVTGAIHTFRRHGNGCKYCRYEKTTGENNSKWKGGSSTFSEYIRAALYDWKFTILKAHDFKCHITRTRDVEDLHVHHLTPFHVVRDRIMARIGIDVRPSIGTYSEQEIKTITQAFKNAHEEIKGVPLLKSVHELFHSIYGYNATEEDFYEFKELCLSGKIDLHIAG